MTPEDRVSTTMELSEDVEAKVATIKKNNAEELELLPQGKRPRSQYVHTPKMISFSKSILRRKRPIFFISI